MSEDKILKLIEEAKSQIKKKDYKYSDNVYKGFIDLIHNLIGDYTLSESGVKDLMKTVDKFGAEATLRGVHEAKKYLRTETEDEIPTKQNVEEFLSKIGAVTNLIDRSELEKRVYYVMGIARNVFGPWSVTKVKTITENALRFQQSEYPTEEDLLIWLNDEYIPYMKGSRNWTTWREGLPLEWLDN